MQKVTWAGLDVHICGGPDRQGGGTGPIVVLLHGFGASGNDLVGLGQMLDVPQETRFVFPAGPLSLSLGFGESRAWWMLDMERLFQERSRGNWETLTHEVPIGLQAARDHLTGLLNEVQTRMNVPSSQILLGGFSQGAMLACDSLLRSTQTFAGLILLSGSLIARTEWSPFIPGHKGLRVFQSHGTQDPILSPIVARQLRDLLEAGGLNLEWIEFQGGHEIPFGVLERLGAFIRSTWSSH